MNNKFFCRVVTNAYGLISNKLTLDKEIDLLRESGYSTINELNEIHKFHKKIINKNGCLTFSEIVTFFEKITCLKLENSFLYKLSEFYYREKQEIIFMELINRHSFSNSILLLGELLINSIRYKLGDEFVIVRKSFFNFEKCDEMIMRKKLEIMENDSYLYLKKKRNFSIDDIKSIIFDFKNKYFELINIKEVYLFGSYAKGKNDEYSDVDLAIRLENNNQSSFIESTILTKLKEEYDMESDIVLLGNKLDEFDETILKYSIRIV